MDENTLAKIQLEIENLRAHPGNIKRGELVSIAERLGREHAKRGKEPTYVQKHLPNRFPLSIPNHVRIAKFTALSILDVLEGDVEAWQTTLSKKGK